MKLSETIKVIQAEISKVVEESSIDEIEDIIFTLLSSKRIITVGAGRVGLVMSAFAKRLAHLGLDAYFLSDSNVPKIGKNDVLVVGSGSGETQSIVLFGNIAKKNGSKQILVTANIDSSLGNLSDYSLILKCPHKYSKELDFVSSQPMTTLFEQVLLVVLDGLVVKLMAAMNVDERFMKERHNVLE